MVPFSLRNLFHFISIRLHRSLSGTLLDDRYLFMECLGTGSTGKVYKAIDVTMSKDKPPCFAVKCLRKSQRGPFEASFQMREFLIHHAASRHRNVVTLHEIIVNEPHVYVVLDLCDGGDMFYTIIAKDYFPQRTDRVKTAFLQILDALHHCHQCGIFHRDVKPENILFSGDRSQAYLADFGLATLEPYSGEHGCGSLQFMSPECIGKEFGFQNKLYSTRANDTWALGVLLMNMITACVPWIAAKTRDAHFRAYLDDDDYFLSVQPISEAANNILKRIFDLDPSSRISLPELRNEIVALDTFFSPARDPVTGESMPIEPDKTSPRNSAGLRFDYAPLSAPGPSAVESSVLAVPDADHSLTSAASSSMGPITPETRADVVQVKIKEVPGIIPPGNEVLEPVVRNGHIFRDLEKPTWIRKVVPKSSCFQRFVQRLTPASKNARQ